MKRRTIVKAGLLIGPGAALGESGTLTLEPEQKRSLVIDCHHHAGKGMNFGKYDAAPWTTFNDPEWGAAVGERSRHRPHNHLPYQQSDL